MGDQSKHMATRAVSTCTRMMIFGLFLGVLAATSEPTDMHDPGQVEAKLTNEVLPESEWKPMEFLERHARGSDKKPPELQLSQRTQSIPKWLQEAREKRTEMIQKERESKTKFHEKIIKEKKTKKMQGLLQERPAHPELQLSQRTQSIPKWLQEAREKRTEMIQKERESKTK